MTSNIYAKHLVVSADLKEKVEESLTELLREEANKGSRLGAITSTPISGNRIAYTAIFDRAI